jgi:hypothetical protein
MSGNGVARSWFGWAFALFSVVAAIGTAVAGAQGEWIRAGSGAAMTAIFVLAALVRLMWPGDTPRLAEVGMLLASFAWLVLAAVQIF